MLTLCFYNANSYKINCNHRLEMSEKASGTNDDIIFIKLEQDDFFGNAENTNNIEKHKFEKELQSEKENAELKGDLLKMKHEKEKLEKDLQMEKLKYEVSLLKAEKQFGMDVKVLSDGKRCVENELESVKTKKTKLDEEKSRFEEEIKALKEHSQKLLNSYMKLQADKNRFETWYNKCMNEKEGLIKQNKALVNELKTLNSIKGCKQDVNFNLLEKTLIQGSFNRLDLTDVTALGIIMIFRKKTICFSYEYCYENIMERIPGNCFSEKEFLWIKGYGVPTASKYVSLGLMNPRPESQLVKLLHTKDNTKSKKIEHINGDKWLITGLTKDYLRNGFYLIFVYKNSGN